MAQFYTLEEAARVLGMNPEDLKAKAQQREVRAFLDGGSWRFRMADIDELARRRGLGSDPELRLSDLEVPTASDDDADLSEFQMNVGNPELGGETMDLGAATSGDHDILLDDLSLPPNPVSGSSSVIIGMGSMGRLPSESDVRLVPDLPQQPSDSDVRIAGASGKAPSDSDVTLVAEDTGSHGVVKPRSSGDTAIRPSPLSGSSPGAAAPKKPVRDEEGESDFELTPSGMMEALEPDSGSDFELTALEGSDEFEATPMLRPSDSDVTAADPGLSGINLSRPSDSGINLQMATGFNLGAADSIELAPLSGDEIKAASPPRAKAPSPAKTPVPSKINPALAETPLPSRPAEKDIFDDTDFEVDALDSDLDSDDKTMQLEAASDFELEESDTGSEVFAIDEEVVDHNAATAMSPAVLDEEEEEEDEDGFDAVAADEIESAWDVESEPTPSRERAASPVLEARGAAAASPEWGGLWVALLGVATVFMLLLAFVSIDLVRNLYDFRNDSPASGIVKSLSGMIFG